MLRGVRALRRVMRGAVSTLVSRMADAYRPG